MNTYRQRGPNRQRSRDPLDRRMDNWFETGRQFVDGVAGNRPGQRRSGQPIAKGLDNVGRWVEDKIDWFFEEDNDWDEPWQSPQFQKDFKTSQKKRPLEAISLRGTKSLGAANQGGNLQNEEDSWPDDSSLRVNRWERQVSSDFDNPINSSVVQEEFKPASKRPLPRSSRRRN